VSSAAIATPVSSRSTREIAEAAKRASRTIATLDEAARNAALETMAKAVEDASANLFAANESDLVIAQSFSGTEKLSSATLTRLKLNEAKLREMAEQMRSVAALPDPLSRKLDAIELDTGLNLEKISVPLGVLAVIFEARPDAVTQIAALALKSGNAVILKAGKEVEQTAAVLVRVLRAALTAQGLPEDAVSLVVGRERVAELLSMHAFVDMVIPRGSKALVEYVQANTRIPVLGHAEGVCHIYVDRDAASSTTLRPTTPPSATPSKPSSSIARSPRSSCRSSPNACALTASLCTAMTSCGRCCAASRSSRSKTGTPSTATSPSRSASSLRWTPPSTTSTRTAPRTPRASSQRTTRRQSASCARSMPPA
jgi:hypothetical protein